MRDIKFKAIRVDNGEWAIGDLHKNESFTKAHIHPTGQRVISFDVIPETVCQFTNVDAIGDGVSLELFEHDLIKMELRGEDIVFEVKFIEGAFMLFSDKIVGEIPIHEFCNYENGYFICGEIIGNIHEGDK